MRQGLQGRPQAKIVQKRRPEVACHFPDTPDAGSHQVDRHIEGRLLLRRGRLPEQPELKLHGGKNLGPRPMEMMLLGLGACTSFDVMHILQKSRAEVTDCSAEFKAERANTVPSVFTCIHVHFIVTGNNLKEALVKRAIKLSAEKYCSASIMLEKGGVEITHDYEIRQQEST